MSDPKHPVGSSSLRRRRVLGGAVAAVAALAAPRLAFAAKDKVVLQMGWIKSVQYGGYFAGLEKGFFDAEGIEAEFLSGGPSIDSVNVVASGQALVGDRDSTNIILARAKGIPVKAFAAAYQVSPYSLITAKGKKINTLKEMEGKTIAIPQGRRATMTALLKRANVDATKITFVPTGTDPGILATGQVDGYFGWYTNQGSMLTQRGFAIDYTTEHDLGNPTYPVTLFALDETIDKKKDLLVRYFRAQAKAWKFFADNPEAIAKVIVEKYGPRGLDLEQQIGEAKITSPLILMGEAATNGPLWIDTPFFKDGIAFGKEAGFLTTDVPVSSVVTQEIAKAAKTAG